MRNVVRLSLALALGLAAILVQNLHAQEAAPAGFFPATHSGPQKKSALPPGFGREHIERSCIACHTTEIIRNKRHTREEWREIVNKMVSLGAQLEKEEAEVVIYYLADKFGPDDPYGI